MAILDALLLSIARNPTSKWVKWKLTLAGVLLVIVIIAGHAKLARETFGEQFATYHTDQEYAFSLYLSGLRAWLYQQGFEQEGPVIRFFTWLQQPFYESVLEKVPASDGERYLFQAMYEAMPFLRIKEYDKDLAILRSAMHILENLLASKTKNKSLKNNRVASLFVMTTAETFFVNNFNFEKAEGLYWEEFLFTNLGDWISFPEASNFINEKSSSLLLFVGKFHEALLGRLLRNGFPCQDTSLHTFIATHYKLEEAIAAYTEANLLTIQEQAFLKRMRANVLRINEKIKQIKSKCNLLAEGA